MNRTLNGKMNEIHRLILRAKHWQVFVAVLTLMVAIGYPCYLIGQALLGWSMPLGDSPAPGIVLYLCTALWFDVILTVDGRTKGLRILSLFFLLSFVGIVSWLRKDLVQPSFIQILPVLGLAIAYVWVVVAQIVRSIARICGPAWSQLPFVVNVLIVAVWFPFGLWFIQPKLNAAMSANSK